MIAVWWYVQQVSPKEVHVYPAQEPSHLLQEDRCRCCPEVRVAGAVKMIVHRKIIRAPLKPTFAAHWITRTEKPFVVKSKTERKT